MEFVGKVFTTVSEFYNDLNPSTLSGAIDVVVVESADGQLSCSPFHVRFGKIALLRPQEKVVQILCNRKPVDFAMKVGEAGEAFFVVETTKSVPFEFETSPLAGPEEATPQMQMLDDLNLDSSPAPVEVAAESVVSSSLPNALAPTVAETLTKDIAEKPFAGPLKLDIPPLTADDGREIRSARPISTAFSTPIEVTYPLSDTEFELAQSPPQPTSWAKIPSTRRSDQGPLSDTELDYSHPGNRPAIPPDWNWEWGNLPARPTEAAELQSVAVVPNVPNIVNREIPPELSAESSLSSSSWEMSLCGSELTAENARSLFDTHKVAYDTFAKTPQLLTDSSLIFRFKNEFYFTWAFVAPILVSQSIFKQAPDDSALNAIKDASPVVPAEIPPAVPAVPSSFPGSWKSWWNRSPDAAAKSPPSPTKSTITGGRSSSVAMERKVISALDESTLRNRHSVAVSKNVEADVFRNKRYTKTLRLTSEQLKSLKLNYGANDISFSVNTSFSGTATCNARIFLWKHDVQVVISDIDGTITKSDALGHLFSMVGKDWTHPGIANLYTKVSRNGYEFLYLTSRAIGQADWTRMYLQGVEQDSYQLPAGPVIMSPDRLIAALKREVIDRRPEEFKIAALKDILGLFKGHNPFYAGFGNRITDAMSYRAVEIPAYRIYSIDPEGQIKMDFFFGYSSSYIKLTDLVDHIFPPTKRYLSKYDASTGRMQTTSEKVHSPEMPQPQIAESVEEGYNDYHFWRITPQFPDDLPEEELDEPVLQSTDFDDMDEDSDAPLNAVTKPRSSSASLMNYVLGATSAPTPASPSKSTRSRPASLLSMQLQGSSLSTSALLKPQHPMASTPTFATPVSPVDAKGYEGDRESTADENPRRNTLKSPDNSIIKKQ